MGTSREYYIYAYLREDKTPYYIGKGKGNRAFIKGKSEVKPPKDKSRIIFLKQNLLEEEAFKYEVYMIAVLGRKDLGTGILRNKTNGGEGISGLIHNQETRKKIGEANRGKSISEETRRKRSEVNKGENNPFYGKTHSEESKRKQSEAKKGKTHSQETRRKLSEIKKVKFAGKNHPLYGKSHSEETKRKQSEAIKGKTHSQETRRKVSEAKREISGGTTEKEIQNYLKNVLEKVGCLVVKNKKPYKDTSQTGTRALYRCPFLMYDTPIDEIQDD